MALTKVKGHIIADDAIVAANIADDAINAAHLDSSASPTFTDLTLTGNLTVQGTTTTLDTATLNVEDKNITLNYASGDSSSSADGAGITIQDAVDASNDATFNWGASNDRFKLSHGLEVLTGNVGIGTSSPDALLEVEGSNATGDGIRIGTSSNNSAGSTTIALQTNNADRATIKGTRESSTGGKLTFETKVAGGSLTERMVIKNDGLVGIGNTNPSGMHSNANKLVVGTGSGDQGMSIYAGTSTGRYAFARAVGNNTDAYDGGMSYDGNRNLKFHTNAGSTRMTITGTGNVGIGTTNPSFASGGGLEIERAGIATLRLQNKNFHMIFPANRTQSRGELDTGTGTIHKRCTRVQKRLII